MRGGWDDPNKKIPTKTDGSSARDYPQKGAGARLTACHIAPVAARAGQ
jgi:hypothetical protein